MNRRALFSFLAAAPFGVVGAVTTLADGRRTVYVQWMDTPATDHQYQAQVIGDAVEKQLRATIRDDMAKQAEDRARLWTFMRKI